MSYLLCIDTALDLAQIALGRNGEVLAHLTNPKQTDHAAWIHEAIQKILRDQEINIKQLSAIAVCIGPGSYTGLRVGLSAAKGLCYALGIPLITISSLELIARSFWQREASFFCPMIDARRMEVFTAVFDAEMKIVREPEALILKPDSYEDFLSKGVVIFCGSGCEKYKPLVQNSNAIFISGFGDIIVMNRMAQEAFAAKRFADVAYSEPLYLKEFHDTSKK